MALKEINASEFVSLQKNYPVDVVDVRTKQEFDAGHMENSKHIPMDEISQRESEIDWDKKVVFVCRSGARSGVVARFFSEQGKEAYNLLGGVFEC